MFHPSELESAANVSGAFFLPSSVGKFVRYCLYQYQELVRPLSGELDAAFNEAIASYTETTMIGQLIFTYASLPDFALLCDGSLHLIAAWPLLAEALGEEYIQGDYFAVPDLTGMLVEGGEVPGVVRSSNSVSLLTTNLPDHKHNVLFTEKHVATGESKVNSLGGTASQTTTATGSNVPVDITNSRVSVRIGIIGR